MLSKSIALVRGGIGLGTRQLLHGMHCHNCIIYLIRRKSIGFEATLGGFTRQRPVIAVMRCLIGIFGSGA